MRIATLWMRYILQDDAACVRLPATEAVRDIMTALGTPDRQQFVLESALDALCGKHKRASTFSLRQTAIRLIHQLSLTDTAVVSHDIWKRYLVPFSLLLSVVLTQLQAVRTAYQRSCER